VILGMLYAASYLSLRLTHEIVHSGRGYWVDTGPQGLGIVPLGESSILHCLRPSYECGVWRQRLYKAIYSLPMALEEIAHYLLEKGEEAMRPAGQRRPPYPTPAVWHPPQ
jgi:hypothetical protein